MKKRMMAALLLLTSNAVYALPTLNVDGSGILLGASGVDVGGALYDVTFANDSCVNLFNGCDNAAEDFAFQTQDDATLAAQALIDQVFLDGPLGLFDTAPSLTFGCEITDECHTLIPYLFQPNFNFNVRTVNAINYDPTFVDGTFPGLINNSDDISGNSYGNYAIFTPTAVPEPATYLLFVFGLICLSWSRYRQQRVLA